MNTNIGNNPTLENVGAGVGHKKMPAAPSFSGAAVKEISSKRFSSILTAANDYVSSPEQRLIMGITALCSQPFIDLNNKRVSEDTRLMSCARTLAKIIIGTTVGVLVRKGCIHVANKYTKMIPMVKASEEEVAELAKKFETSRKEANELANQLRSEQKNTNEINAALQEKAENDTAKITADKRYWALPEDKGAILSPPIVRTFTADYHKNYVNALGSIMGIGVSLITNFLIDAPLTQILTEKFYNRFKKNSQKEEVKPENLLEKALKESNNNKNNIEEKNHKTVSFAASDKHSGRNVSFRGNIVESIVSQFEKEKLRFWKNAAANPGDMLLHTGALGWAASSAAQITGIAFNKKIDDDKKKFLIPQELGDATGNIALYYAVTVSLKNYIEGLFESGKIRIKSVTDLMKTDMNLTSEQIDKLFADKRSSMSEKLRFNPITKTRFFAHKNGASIIATLVANVIAGNILTPYFRNFYGAFWQDRAKKRANAANQAIFDLYSQAQKKGIKINQSEVFDKFNL